MKKLLITALTFSLLVIGGVSANASTKTDEILSSMPGVTAEELDQSIKDTSAALGISEDEVIDQIISEMNAQDELSSSEAVPFILESKVRAANTFTLDAARNVGDIFFENSSTLFVNHGHVGIYHSKDTIVESWPGDGVRTMSRFNKQVNSGSKIFTLNDVSQNIKSSAASWAMSQVGCKYSYNFANNRNTPLTGDKNCSKLVWAAYKTAGNLDIDSNGGIGVYPRDILNYNKSSVYKTY